MHTVSACVSRLDRYIFRQLIGPFLFFVVVVTGVIWLSQSLTVIDTVVNNGQTGWVFLEFTALLLPRVMTIVLPVAAFAGTLYAINRLDSESEIVVMQAAGVSRMALLRPVVIGAAGLALVVAVVTVGIVPLSQAALRDRISEVRADVAAAFLREGSFLSPMPGVTVYVAEVGRPGELLGVFVHDRRDPEQVATYTAERAVLIDHTAGPRLVMFDGIAQIERPDQPEALSVLYFAQFGYDLSRAGEGGRERQRKPSELHVGELLTMTQAEAGDRPLSEYRAEAHEALSSPLYVPALMALAVAVVARAGFRRRGFSRRVVVAVAVALTLRLLGLAAKSLAAREAAFWPLLYLPPLGGFGLAVWLLIRPGRRGRGPARGEFAVGVAR